MAARAKSAHSGDQHGKYKELVQRIRAKFFYNRGIWGGTSVDSKSDIGQKHTRESYLGIRQSDDRKYSTHIYFKYRIFN